MKVVKTEDFNTGPPKVATLEYSVYPNSNGEIDPGSVMKNDMMMRLENIKLNVDYFNENPNTLKQFRNQGFGNQLRALPGSNSVDQLVPYDGYNDPNQGGYLDSIYNMPHLTVPYNDMNNMILHARQSAHPEDVYMENSLRQE